MENFIFDKTDRGREEIATRMYHLASRLRSLLVMIDGKQGTTELLLKVAGLGLTMGSFTELAGAGFIRDVSPAAASAPVHSLVSTVAAVSAPVHSPVSTAAAVSAPVHSPVSAAAALSTPIHSLVSTVAAVSAPVHSPVIATVPFSVAVAAAPRAAPDMPTADAVPQPSGAGTVEQILALHAFFNGTIKSAIGLRGFTLQLKAERAMTLADFSHLREPFLAAVLKSKGIEMARSLGARLDQLLSCAEA